MLRQKLIDLKDWILLYNPYYNKGFANVFQDDQTGIINDGSQTIFPSDTFGNYFYLRLENEVKFRYTTDSNISDSQLSLRVDTPVILVALCKDGKPDTMIENLLTTIGRYQQVNMVFASATYQSDFIILRELSKIKKENIQHALQSLDMNSTLISIKFSISFPFVFQQLKCLQPPC